MAEETIACKWCGEPTIALTTKECDFCWELRTKIEHSNKAILKKMLAECLDSALIPYKLLEEKGIHYVG